MKNYDYSKAHSFIEANKKTIISASLGMNEDWFWTAQTIFENGEYTIDLFQEDLNIAGLTGSSWATPTLEIIYFDDTDERIECSQGDYNNEITKRLEQEFFVKSSLGCLSGPLQEKRGDITRKI